MLPSLRTLRCLRLCFRGCPSLWFWKELRALTAVGCSHGAVPESTALGEEGSGAPTLLLINQLRSFPKELK